jgi:hypothetical protein
MDGMGLMLDHTPSEEARALKLAHDAPHRRKHLEAHERALRGGPRERRRYSFAMAQGAFVAYGRAAAIELLQFTTHSAGARTFLGASAGTAAAAPPALSITRPGKCGLQGDVAMGWLTTRAFSTPGQPLAVIPLLAPYELFIWPSFRHFSPRHSVVVHLANTKAGNETQIDAVLSAYDAKVVSGHTPLVKPRFRCERSRWLHATTMLWTECRNEAVCDTAMANAIDEWQPQAVRDRCTHRATESEVQMRMKTQ